jgi:hypothetical protein
VVRLRAVVGGEELAELRGEDLATTLDLEEVRRAQEALARTVFNSSSEGSRRRARWLLEGLARQTLARLTGPAAEAAPEAAAAVLDNVLMVLPDEAEVGLRRATLLAHLHRWDEMCPLLERVRRSQLTPGQREQLERLERRELEECRRSLPAVLPAEEWDAVWDRLRALARRFGEVPDYLVLRCAALAAFSPKELDEDRLLLLREEYQATRARFLALPID